MGLLAYAIGEPLKRQQILTGQMPVMAPTRDEMRATINRKLAAQLNRDDVTVSELIAAAKTLADSAGEREPLPERTDEEHAQMIARALRLPPGSGKKMMDRKAGQTRVFGEDSQKLSPATRARIGYLPEGHHGYGP